MKRIPILTSFVILLSIFSVSHSTASGNGFSSPPSNIKIFEANLSNSLVGTNCGGVPGIGFAGNYSISPEMKNQGINSLVFTTATATMACRFFGNQFSMIYQGNTYPSTIHFWNGQSPDMASFTTSVNIPPLPLYGTDLPEADWWVDVARYVPNFGIVWSTSIVRLVNSTTDFLAIDPIVPAATNNALVFNSQGTFLGVVSAFGSTAPTGTIMVQGAPLQCQISKAQSAPTVTICGIYQNDVWTASSSSSQSTTTVVPAQSSLLDQSIIALNAITDASNYYSDAIVACKAIGSDQEIQISNLITGSQWSRSCGAEDAAAAGINSAVATIRTSIQNSPGAITKTIIDQLTAYSVSLRAKGVATNNLMNDLIASISDFATLSATVESLDQSISGLFVPFDSLNAQINRLPTVLRQALTNSAQFKDLSKFRIDLTAQRQTFNELRAGLAEISSAIDLQTNLDELSALQLDTYKARFNALKASVLKIYPSGYCSKNSKVVALSKSGTCVKGWLKTNLKVSSKI